jgi:hypothetical protein
MKHIYDNMEIDTQFNLIKSKVNEKDLRAYIYQKMYNPFNENTCFQAVNELHFLTDNQMRQWRDGYDLKLLNFFQLEKLAEKVGLVVPVYIYYFIQDYDFDGEDYRSYPQIFDHIESVSFDKGGLIVLYSKIALSYHLFSADGIELARTQNSTIKIGMNGHLQFDDCFDNEEKGQSEIDVNWNFLRQNESISLFQGFESNFPDIRGRDLLPIMENWTKPAYSKDYLNQLYDESIAKEILKKDGCLIRHMPVFFKENQELGYIACVQNILAYTLLSKLLQEDTKFISRLLESEEVDSKISNFIFFDRKGVTSVESKEDDKSPADNKSFHQHNPEETTIEIIEKDFENEVINPIWNPLIIEKFDSITPNITKKEPDYFELLAYLYQLTTSDFVFAEPLTKKYSEVLDSRPIEEILNDTELQNDIENSLWREGCYPTHIYIFKQRKPVAKNNFKTYPKIYTQIIDVTFDKGGLLIMESFCDDNHSLHDISGDILLSDCSIIMLGMDGLVAYKTSEVIKGSWTFERYENGKLNECDSINSLFDWNLTGFPFIFHRDRVKYMKRWEIPYCEPTMIMTLNNKNVIKDILEKDGCLIRYMQDSVKEDEEIALLACQTEIAFTLIPKKFQQDKNFVLKLYSLPNIDVNLYNFFNWELQNDSDIIKIKLEKKSNEFEF